MDAEKQGMAVRKCRVCESRELEPVLNLGMSALANRYLTRKQLAEPEPRFLLRVLLCPHCLCVQLGVMVEPEMLFPADYAYTSGDAGDLKRHFESYAAEAVEKLELKPGDLVVGIGGNDGTLERAFQEHGMKVLNIEPSERVATLSRENGVLTLDDWFDGETAREVAEGYLGQADLITCNNCFAHMPDLNEVMTGIKILLKPNGWLLIESADLEAISKSGLFDQFYHEHCFYWHQTSLRNLMRRFGMGLIHWDYIERQGGSFRAWIKNGPGTNEAFEPSADGYARLRAGFSSLQKSLENWKHKAGELLKSICNDNTRVACYGWPAKATLIGEMLGFEELPVHYAVDEMPSKQGLFTPGSRLPIVSRNHFLECPPDYCLLTASNYQKQIIKANPQFQGKWVQLLPEPRVLDGGTGRE